MEEEPSDSPEDVPSLQEVSASKEESHSEMQVDDQSVSNFPSSRSSLHQARGRRAHHFDESEEEEVDTFESQSLAPIQPIS